MVRFRGDVVLLRPFGGGNRRAILSVPNRGMERLLCPADLTREPRARAGILPRRDQSGPGPKL
jgi:hypothetical protein